MPSLALPPAVLASLAVAGVVAGVEVLGWALLAPLYGRLLPFSRAVADLPRVRDPKVLDDFYGSGRHVTWRWRPGAQAILFRRRIEPSRRPWSTGALFLRADGSWRLAWAPFPFFTWAAVAAAWVAWLLGQGARLPLPLFAGASGVLVLVIAANLWLSRQAFLRLVWPELRGELVGWVGE
ncbi:MAG: hypothetical protein ABIO70_21465 [Pseudomonadota bacterium]